MCQIKTPSENSPSAPVADRLLERVAQGNPLVALGAALVLPLVRLFARRKPAPAAIRREKIELERYSYSPMVGQRAATQGTKDPQGIYKASAKPGASLRPPAGCAPASSSAIRPATVGKGGCRHGHN